MQADIETLIHTLRDAINDSIHIMTPEVPLQHALQLSLAFSAL